MRHRPDEGTHHHIVRQHSPKVQISRSESKTLRRNLKSGTAGLRNALDAAGRAGCRRADRQLSHDSKPSTRTLHLLAAGGDLGGSAPMNVAAEVDELVALAQSLALSAITVEAAVIRAGGSAEEASRVRACVWLAVWGLDPLMMRSAGGL